MMVRVGTEFLVELAANGLTAPMLDAVTVLADDFSDLIVDLKIEIGNRDIEQESRVESGNTIYTSLVKYIKTGQSICESTNIAKFNDYIIYNIISGEPEAPTP